MSHNLREGRPVEILLAEDNEADVRFCQEVLKTVSIPTQLHVVDDGKPALEFLRKRKGYTHVPTPDLVLLDLFLPVFSGHEVFVEMKRDVALARIPVCIFVMDEYDPSIAKIERQGFEVGCSLTKPVQADRLTAILNQIRDSMEDAPPC
jgi:CheY-like chemotaxis protein